MRRLGQYLLRTLQNRLAGLGWMTELTPETMARSAVVFAPHPDDETLGCGGTLIKKRAAGARVTIAFMTDGRTSHSHLMAVDRLITLRAQEATAAARVLGLGESNICFLGFPDRRLHVYENAARARVEEILALKLPEQVFIPYCRDKTPDHLATHRIVSTALARLTRSVTVCEYPIWFWRHWPWVPVPPRREGLKLLRESFSAGWRLLGSFRCYVSVADVLDRKRAALEQYASQMTRLIPDPRWNTLNDVAGGDFLKCFFQPREVFCCYESG
ncbi:MAG: PIG-L deacetylase family protein [Acidobacteriota bacterium]